MIIINKSGHLIYKDLKFRCALGKGGVGKKNTEGDNITPKGTFKIVKIYWRKDRIGKISSKFKLVKITKNMGWCDDPKSKKYNRFIKLPTKFKHEKLHRKDNLYDLVLVTNFNMRPTIKNKGSAIFIHVANKKYSSTKGCIALSKNDLIKLIKDIKKNSKIIVN